MVSKKHPLVKEVLVTHKQIKKRTKELASEIADFYRHQPVKDNTVVVVGLLRGAIPFMAEFINHFDYNMQTDYMTVSSYGGTIQGNLNPQITLDIVSDVKDRHVLVIDDVVDSGLTLALVKNHLLNRGAKDVRFVTLINKPGNAKRVMQSNWSGFTLGNEFLIGFGLDYEERLRNLPYIAAADMTKLKGWKW